MVQVVKKPLFLSRGFLFTGNADARTVLSTFGSRVRSCRSTVGNTIRRDARLAQSVASHYRGIAAKRKNQSSRKPPHQLKHALYDALIETEQMRDRTVAE